jgi:hypothetical protein
MLDATLGVRGGQAGLLKYACAISDDRFRIQEQKSALVTATAARDPERAFCPRIFAVVPDQPPVPA